MLQGDGRRCVAFEHREQVALPPDVMAFTVQILAWGFACLFLEFLLLLFDPTQLGNVVKTRMVSRLIRDGAAIRTLPLGGYTLRWMFLMSLSTTSTVISPHAICVTISIPSAL